MGRARDRGAFRVCAARISAAVLTRSSRTQAAASYGCEVDTLTLSKEQKREAEMRVEAEVRKGTIKAGAIRVHLCDYRECPAEFEGAFDAFVSVEMLEVGGCVY